MTKETRIVPLGIELTYTYEIFRKYVLIWLLEVEDHKSTNMDTLHSNQTY